MNFFEEQDLRRKNRRVLLFSFFGALVVINALAYLLTLVTIYFLAWDFGRGTPDPFQWWNPQLFGIVFVVSTGVIGLASLFMRRRLAKGGVAVALLLNGDLVLERPIDPGEKRFLNVVEEIAIASTMPVPLVFVLSKQNGINAFAAGYTPSDAVIGVTRGCIDLLTRDELQAVVAHEFAHIRNGDMRLNLQMISALQGLLLLHTWGKYLIGGTTRGRGGGILAIFGVGLSIIGWFGVFLGKLIRFAVSRQCEYLADAAAVQFTRNPSGMAGALKKIGGVRGGAQIKHHYAETMNHLFFESGVRKFGRQDPFSSHPKLWKRIRKIEPTFDGTYPSIVLPVPKEFVQPSSVTKKKKEERVPVIPALSQHAAITKMGDLIPEHLHLAGIFLATLGDELQGAAHDSVQSRALIYALLLDSDSAHREEQMTALATRIPEAVHSDMKRMAELLKEREEDARLPLVDLTIPSLRKLSEEEKQTFIGNVEWLSRFDGKLSVFEFALEKILKRSLIQRPQKGVQFYAMKPLLPDAEVLLSILAYTGQKNIQSATEAFVRVGHLLGRSGLGMVPPKECSFARLEKALDRIALSGTRLKQRILEASTVCVAADGKVTLKEAELLRAIAAALDVPVPTMLLPQEEAGAQEEAC